ncbi:MAG: DNA/RNA helicase domain-containing protein [Paraclostridium sp.]
MGNRENVGLMLTIKELIDNSSEDIISRLEAFIDSIGYKKCRGEKDGFNQKDAWKIEIDFLQEHFKKSRLDMNTYILFEYILPGENTERPDVLVLFEKCVYSLEFKTIGSKINSEYVAQFIDYRTMLQEYHDVCIKKGLIVKSNLVMCNCDYASMVWDEGVEDKIDSNDRDAVIARDKFQALIDKMANHKAMVYDDVIRWVESSRARSKKIWEQGLELKNNLMSSGTTELYSRVKSIPYSDLRAAQDKINELIQKDEKKIIFVSGVPGAGKTLIGMITLFASLGDKRNARYYTGNGALKNVLSRTMDSRDISMFTAFRGSYIRNKEICHEEILIFDEAQRFWNGDKNELNITDAKGVISTLYEKNVSIVCLIGNGQKPMSGEAGIEAWIDALKKDKTWRVYAPKVHENEFVGVDTEFYEDLYLDVAKRQHFVDLSGWVEAVLDGDLQKSKDEIKIIKETRERDKFGICITRSLERLYSNNGTRLVKHKAEREEKSNSKYLFGLLCSSKNKMERMSKLTNGIIYQRFEGGQSRPKTNTYIDNNKASEWYGGGCCDTCNVKVATETFCQGLEVDLPIIFFGGDYLIKKDGAHYTRVIDPSDFARNRYGNEIETIMEDTYRILLTRATEEMILVIPQTYDGRFDDTYNFFKEMGIKEF